MMGQRYRKTTIEPNDYTKNLLQISQNFVSLRTKRFKTIDKMHKTVCAIILFSCLAVSACQAQGFKLKKENDSLYWLNDWRLDYPVYQFQTGDVNGDGIEDAMVGVIKSTRFYPEKARRLFIFKQVNGKARPIWLGSKLGGILEDFRFIDGKIRALESTTDSLYVVSDYRWSGFGMKFDHYIIKGVDKQTAIKTFSQ